MSFTTGNKFCYRHGWHDEFFCPKCGYQKKWPEFLQADSLIDASIKFCGRLFGKPSVDTVAELSGRHTDKQQLDQIEDCRLKSNLNCLNIRGDVKAELINPQNTVITYTV